MHLPLYEIWPKLANRLPIVPLGELPTRVDISPQLAARTARDPGEVWIKRDDLTSPVFGGNKVRALELLFGAARAENASRVYSTGAYGSNQAVATVLHAPRAELEAGVILYPQPKSPEAVENVRVIGAFARDFVAIPHWSALPLAMERVRRHVVQGRAPYVTPPGGASPIGALGYVAAGLELGGQIARGELPRPTSVVVAVGSTATCAGLLVGFELAAKLGMGFVDGAGHPAPPLVVGVRVTPWPVATRRRILSLAMRVCAELASLTQDPRTVLERRVLSAHLELDTEELGSGYGYATAGGVAAIGDFHDAGGPELDVVYSGKAGAAFLKRLRRGSPGPIVFWATRSTAPLPGVPESRVVLPPAVREWLDHTD